VGENCCPGDRWKVGLVGEYASGDVGDQVGEAGEYDGDVACKLGEAGL